MKYLNLTKQLVALAVVAAVFSSCEKVAEVEPLGDKGTTIVKLIGGGSPATLNKKPVDFVNTPTKILAVELRRDIPNETELNKTMVVTIKDDTAAVRTANPAYLHFPTAWYTIQTDGVKTGGQGGTFTFTFKPGEYAKEIYITIPDATLMNPSNLYGLGFTITTADAGSRISSQKAIVVEIGAKNNWDGLYEVSGSFTDLVNSAFTSDYPFTYALVTSGASTCDVINVDLNGGIPGYLFLNAGAGTYYGSYGLVITFNPANNAISSIHNYYGDKTKATTSGGTPSTGTGAPDYESSNTRRAVLDPSGVNAVQGNKDIVIKHWLVQRSVVPAPPSIRSTFDETWKYIGPR